MYRCAGGLATLRRSPIESPIEGLEVTMAKGQMRSNREKKKPKQDKNKKKRRRSALTVRQHAQPSQTRHLVHEPIRQEALAGDHRARNQHAAAGVNDFIRGCTVARVAGCRRRVPNTAIEMLPI